MHQMEHLKAEVQRIGKLQWRPMLAYANPSRSTTRPAPTTSDTIH